MNPIRKFILAVTLASLPAMAAEVNTVFEVVFESSRVHANPFVDVEVDVRFSKDGREWKVPAFWDGGRSWKVRFAAPEEGAYRYRAVANDPSGTPNSTSTPFSPPPVRPNGCFRSLPPSY